MTKMLAWAVRPFHPASLSKSRSTARLRRPSNVAPCFKTAGRVAKHFADIGRGEFYAETLIGIWQQAERAFGNRALARIGIGGWSSLVSCENAATEDRPTKTQAQIQTAVGRHRFMELQSVKTPFTIQSNFARSGWLKRNGTGNPTSFPASLRVNPPIPRRTRPPCATSRFRRKPACRTRPASSASGCRRRRQALRPAWDP